MTLSISTDLAIGRSAFDELARSYDAVFTDSCVGRAQREAVWRELDQLFFAGSRVLEIGCGTGVDACHLASRNVQVVACDSSAQMIGVAEERVRRERLEELVNMRLLSAEDIARVQGPFDGALSNFGVLNCVDDLGKLSRQMASLLRPQARMLVCFMGPFCLWETIWYLAQGKPAKAWRRLNANGVEAKLAHNGEAVRVRYPSVSTVVREFAPEFRLVRILGIGLAVPPSYLEPWAKRFPRLLHGASRLDRVLGQIPGIRLGADHILLNFERTIA
jgi:ubiquinone/menaquinone biosynthesis C-methylase UbiE